VIAALQGRWLVAIATVVALAQIAVLGSMIWSRAAILRSGTEVMLEVRPIDPRDLLRGDYVVVGYTISNLDKSLFGGETREDYSGPHTVYVRLARGADGLWEAAAARLDSPFDAPGADGEVDIRGIASYFPPDLTPVPVDYGIERFYLPEGEGLAIEQGMGVRPFRMKVAVAADGSPQIKSFHDGDTMIFEEPLY
jgi:uncharacterized membrane-anchored protein